MRVVSRRVIIPHGVNRAPLCGFVTYIDPAEPVLLRRNGWEIGDDIHAAFTDTVSRDNGRTWSEPWKSLDITPVEGGHVVHTENAALYLPRRRLLLHFTNDKLERTLEHHTADASAKVHISWGEPMSVSRGEPAGEFVSNYGLPQGLYVSFCTPIQTKSGRILATVQWQGNDPDGSLRKQGMRARQDMPDVMADYWEVACLIGEFDASGGIAWRRGGAVPLPPGISSRGWCEPAIQETTGGTLFMILRTSNHLWPERQNPKRITHSSDGGETWSTPEPLRFDDGEAPESSATGSIVFRSATDGRLYWVGNLCLDGRRPSGGNGNYPREPLYIARLREDPIRLERESATIIDQRRDGEDELVQHSNFKLYQDRHTGEVVIYLTRYGERGTPDNAWIRADHYEYRVALA